MWHGIVSWALQETQVFQSLKKCNCLIRLSENIILYYLDGPQSTLSFFIMPDLSSMHLWMIRIGTKWLDKSMPITFTMSPKSLVFDVIQLTQHFCLRTHCKQKSDTWSILIQEWETYWRKFFNSFGLDWNHCLYSTITMHHRFPCRTC